MFIKIIQGTYGYRGKDGILKPKNMLSDPFELEDEKAKQLIRKGIAKQIKESKNEEKQMKNDTEKEERQSEGNIENMSRNELAKMAKEMGLSGNGSKEELIERILKETEEEPPTLEAEEPHV